MLWKDLIKQGIYLRPYNTIFLFDFILMFLQFLFYKKKG